MYTTSLLLAASSIASLAFAAPVVRRQATSYQLFGGDGSLTQGWPSTDDWLCFDELWTINEPVMKTSCSQFGAENPVQSELDDMKAAIIQAAKDSGLDARYLLVVMMQESKGCPRAPTTNYGQNNPGLFQSFNGRGSCNPDNVNKQFPCPKATIDLMVREGAGIDMPFGLMQAVAQVSGAQDASRYYRASRTYNSGSIAASGNLGEGIATHCYASDIANRLVGWNSDAQHPSACKEESIGSVQGSATAYAGVASGRQCPAPGSGSPIQITPVQKSPAQDDNNKPNTPPAPTNQPTAAAPPANDLPANDAPANQDTPSAPRIPGAAENCKSWYTVKTGDHCSNLSVTFETLRKLNPSIDSTCSNLWRDYAYCIAA
ncbi:uncharacterized protein EI97DRAFT_428155 [Westerdykella ornata]|uniref:LysM domain-containing protein n=1 Tax=Westerdykella ornata TaxID=318751 RepID=A0A6A6J5M9_WESOR|nr:uncharacterized protein EI97DRAFT_428155 [Westerdykella ornata]KAF2271497.1 hypothetical protein EI97DRAFT_428155 [Westerdykella ornata]